MRRNGEADGVPGSSGPWQPPPIVEGYTIVRPLGRGGMGQVYLGRDPGLDRPVALKFIAGGAPSAAARERFLIEARAIARLSHPNIVAIYRVGDIEGRPYIAYELVSGLPLSQHVVPLPWPQVVQVLLGVARGLEAAHGAGVLHRDIKPANVMVSDRGDIKLIDFGLAKLDGGPPGGPGVGDGPNVGVALDGPFPSGAELISTLQPREGGASHGAASLTATGALLGTPAYVAPELWRGRPASTRTDLFAAGLLGYELLAGALPHAGLDMLALASYLTSEDLPPVRAAVPDVPESLSALIARCVRRDPEARIESARALRRALEDIDRVFLPAGAEIVSRPERALLRISFARLRQSGEAFTSSVYARLFRDAPHVRPLFPKEMSAQRQKLLHFLHLAIEGLDDPERLVPILEDLGRRHATYGVRVEHYAPLRRALLDAVLEFDPDADPRELEAAWSGAMSAIEAAMLRGMAQGSETVTSGLGVAGPSASSAPSAPPQPGPGPRSSAPPAASAPPETLYAYNGDVSLAYQVFGQGPGAPDELVLFGWQSHLEAVWQQPEFAAFLRRLGRLGRVLTFDKRGAGMSDRTIGGATLEARVDDLEVVLAAAGVARPVLLGVADGAAHAAALAARRPDRVRGLVLYAPVGRFLAGPGHPYGPTAEELEPLLAGFRARWGAPDSAIARLVAASRADDAAFCAWLAAYCRQVMSPGELIGTVRGLASLDALPLLPAADVPALVLRREGDPSVPAGAARDFAARLPRGRFVSLPGVDYLPFVGEQEPLFDEIAAFLAGLPRGAEGRGAPLRVVLAAALPEGAPEATAAREAAAALLEARLEPGGALVRRPEGLVAVLIRCAAAVEIAADLHALSGGLRIAICAGPLPDGPAQGALLGRALAQAAATPPGGATLDAAAAALLSGVPQDRKGPSSPRLVTPTP